MYSKKLTLFCQVDYAILVSWRVSFSILNSKALYTLIMLMRPSIEKIMFAVPLITHLKTTLPNTFFGPSKIFFFSPPFSIDIFSHLPTQPK